jgi:hypothetical protein
MLPIVQELAGGHYRKGQFQDTSESKFTGPSSAQEQNLGTIGGAREELLGHQQLPF